MNVQDRDDPDFDSLIADEEATRAVRRRSLRKVVPICPNVEIQTPQWADDLPEILITGRELSDMTADAIRALNAKNDPPFIFRYGKEVARIEHQNVKRISEGEQRKKRAPFSNLVTVQIMRNECAKVAHWTQERTDKDGNKYRTGAVMPRAVAENILAESDLALPALRGIFTVPYFTVDGELIAINGYDAKSETYLEVDPDLDIPQISSAPSEEEIQEAVATLDDLVIDFPFDSEASKANAYAAMLLRFVREMIQGPTPLHNFEAPTAGTGKSLLCGLMLIPGCGEVPVSNLPMKQWSNNSYCNDEEIEKLIVSMLSKGDVAVIFDNVCGRVESAPLNAALTKDPYSGRILGASKFVTLPNRATWCMTANNASFSRDTSRRTVCIRLDAAMERPQERSKFRHANVEMYALKNRGKLIWANLILVRAWINAGSPPTPRSLGSFEAWARVIGGILENAGIKGFLGNSTDFQDLADDEAADMYAFVCKWHETFEADEVEARDLLPVARATLADYDYDDYDNEKKKGNLAKSLGKLLRKNRDTVHTGFRLKCRFDSHTKKNMWILVGVPR